VAHEAVGIEGMVNKGDVLRLQKQVRVISILFVYQREEFRKDIVQLDDISHGLYELTCPPSKASKLFM
jgi:hypothetical protein